MMKKKFIKQDIGIVKDIFIPRIYNDETEEYLLDSEVDLIGFIVCLRENKEIKIIVDKNSETTSIYVGDSVFVDFYETLYDYRNYRGKLYEQIYLRNSYLNEKEIDKLFYDNVVSEEEFLKRPRYFFEYDISLNR